jgi:uncharacterized protein YbbC (DUF1343 family)
VFERYTEKARRVIFFTRYEAAQYGASQIATEHLLLGLLREDAPLFARFLPGADNLQDTFRRELKRRTPTLREKIANSNELPLADTTKRALADAHEESLQLGHRHIGTEHLLLGLLRGEGTMAAELLSEQGVRFETVRAALAQQESAELCIQTEASAGVSQSGTHTRVRSGRRTILGLEKLLTARAELLRGARIGLICNQASVGHELQHAADLFSARQDCKLTALFGPQHGIRGEVQDNMVETPHMHDPETGVPVYSLYSETREPTEEMLRDVDVLVFDLQDVGCRIYTFIYTLANCMRVAARYGKKVIVCDRPNPIDGVHVNGTVLEPAYASFVGQFPLATRHGMTVCELAKMFQGEWGLDCDLELVTLDGWARELWLDETDAPWVLPSPNMPTIDTATVFPGTVHLEGTQMSEGRGTTRPFELVGAPYIDAALYARTLNAYGLPGVYFRPNNFQPTFQKHAGRICGGVQIHVTDRAQFEPVTSGVAAVRTARELYPGDFLWKEPPYEYVFDKNPFDVIAGTASLRAAIERGDKLEEIINSWQGALSAFNVARERHLLY